MFKLSILHSLYDAEFRYIKPEISLLSTRYQIFHMKKAKCNYVFFL